MYSEKSFSIPLTKIWAAIPDTSGTCLVYNEIKTNENNNKKHTKLKQLDKTTEKSLNIMRI